MKHLLLFTIQALIAFIGFLSPKFAARVAFYFFSRPKRRKNRDWMQDFLDTSVNDYFSVDGHQIKSYAWKGKGKGVLFLHGWRSNAARWKYLISNLQDLDVDLIAFDAPGHGESKHPIFSPINYAKAIQPLVEKYQPRIIVAHSVGAYTALYHYSQYKPQGIKYVLMAPTYDLMLPINEMFRILKLSEKTRAAYIEYIEDDLGKKMPEVRAVEFIDKQGPEGILLHDINDKILPYADSIQLMDKSKHLSFQKIDSNGHRMQNDEVESVIYDYIRKELGGTSA